MQPARLIVHPVPVDTDLLAVSWDSVGNTPTAHAWINDPAITKTIVYETDVDESEDEEKALEDFYDSADGCAGCTLNVDHEFDVDLEHAGSIVDFLWGELDDVKAYETARIKVDAVCSVNRSNDLRTYHFCPRHGRVVVDTEVYLEAYSRHETCGDNIAVLPAPPLRVTAILQPNGSIQFDAPGSSDSKAQVYLAIQAVLPIAENDSPVFLTPARRGVNMFGGSDDPYPICWGNYPASFYTCLRDAHATYLAAPGNNDMIGADEARDSIHRTRRLLEANVVETTPLWPLPDGLHAVFASKEDDLRPSALLLATSLHHGVAFARLVASGATPRQGGEHAYVALPLFPHTLSTERGSVEGYRTNALANDRAWFILPDPEASEGWQGTTIGQLDASAGYAPCA